MSVTVYTKPACVQCNATYRALDKAGIEYAVVDITENEQAREHVRLHDSADPHRDYSRNAGAWPP